MLPLGNLLSSSFNCARRCKATTLFKNWFIFLGFLIAPEIRICFTKGSKSILLCSIKLWAYESRFSPMNGGILIVTWKNEYKEKFGKSESLEELDDFLNGTKFCFIENISSFLSLNQESYQADIPEIDKFELDVNSNKLSAVLKSLINEDDSKKEQYIKKINSLTDKHARQLVIPTLMNCTHIQIGVLDEIKNPTQRKILLANLGKHLYFTLLDQLEKYDFEKLFPVLIEIENVFANSIFEKLVELINKEEKLNLKLTELFLSYSDSISTMTMNKIDEILANMYATNETAILELIQKHWSSSTWNSNNFSKPTKLFGEFLSSIKLDNTEPDNEKLSTIENIHNTISNQEKDEFILRICEIISGAEETKAKTILPKVFEVSNNQILQKLDDYSNITTLVNVFLKSTEFNPDLEQKKQTFEFLFKIIARYNK